MVSKLEGHALGFLTPASHFSTVDSLVLKMAGKNRLADILALSNPLDLLGSMVAGTERQDASKVAHRRLIDRPARYMPETLLVYRFKTHRSYICFSWS